jgi:hypothetical protein
MFKAGKLLVGALLTAALAWSVAIAASSKDFEGTWNSELLYEGTSYTLELSLAPATDGGKLTGKLRVLDDGYLVETLGLTSVAMSGDSLVVQTEVLDGRAARIALLSGEKELSGRFWETSYSGEAKGQGLNMVFKPKKL